MFGEEKEENTLYFLNSFSKNQCAPAALEANTCELRKFSFFSSANMRHWSSSFKSQSLQVFVVNGGNCYFASLL